MIMDGNYISPRTQIEVPRYNGERLIEALLEALFPITEKISKPEEPVILSEYLYPTPEKQINVSEN